MLNRRFIYGIPIYEILGTFRGGEVMPKIFRIVTLALAMTPFLSAQAPAQILNTSEEHPPAVCDTDEFMRVVKCSGSYCDKVGLSCRRAGNARWGAKVNFTWWVSEESGSKSCPTGRAIAGWACRGGYCDQLSLFCAEIAGARLTNCRSFPGSVSEEGSGRLDIGAGRVAVAMSCKGSNCDNKSFRICDVR